MSNNKHGKEEKNRSNLPLVASCFAGRHARVSGGLRKLLPEHLKLGVVDNVDRLGLMVMLPGHHAQLVLRRVIGSGCVAKVELGDGQLPAAQPATLCLERCQKLPVLRLVGKQLRPVFTAATTTSTSSPSSCCRHGRSVVRMVTATATETMKNG